MVSEDATFQVLTVETSNSRLLMRTPVAPSTSAPGSPVTGVGHEHTHADSTPGTKRSRAEMVSPAHSLASHDAEPSQVQLLAALPYEYKAVRSMAQTPALIQRLRDAAQYIGPDSAPGLPVPELYAHTLGSAVEISGALARDAVLRIDDQAWLVGPGMLFFAVDAVLNLIIERDWSLQAVPVPEVQEVLGDEDAGMLHPDVVLHALALLSADGTRAWSSPDGKAIPAGTAIIALDQTAIARCRLRELFWRGGLAMIGGPAAAHSSIATHAPHVGAAAPLVSAQGVFGARAAKMQQQEVEDDVAGLAMPEYSHDERECTWRCIPGAVRWNSDELMLVWQRSLADVPGMESWKPLESDMAGIALRMGKWCVFMNEPDLPLTAEARFEALWSVQQAWTLASLEPYLARLTGPGCSQADLLLKHTRSARAVAEGSVRMYSRR